METYEIMLYLTNDGELIGNHPHDERITAHRVGDGRWEWWSEQDNWTVTPEENEKLEREWEECTRLSKEM